MRPVITPGLSNSVDFLGVNLAFEIQNIALFSKPFYRPGKSFKYEGPFSVAMVLILSLTGRWTPVAVSLSGCSPGPSSHSAPAVPDSACLRSLHSLNEFTTHGSEESSKSVLRTHRPGWRWKAGVGGELGRPEDAFVRPGGCLLPGGMADEAFGEAGNRVIPGEGFFYNHLLSLCRPRRVWLGFAGREGVRGL